MKRLVLFLFIISIVVTFTNGSTPEQDDLNKKGIVSASSKVRRDAEPRRAGGKFKRPFGGITRKQNTSRQLFERLRRVNTLLSRRQEGQMVRIIRKLDSMLIS